VALNIDLPFSVFAAAEAGNNGCGSGLKMLLPDAAVAGRSVGMFFLDML
jgi:hypothetical protein